MLAIDAVLQRQLASAATGWSPTALRRAAVLCLLVAHGGDDQVLLIARPPHLRQHGGQIGFPGGMRHGEETVVATALRECQEELGVPPAAITLLGTLSQRESSSGILVHCLVGRLAATPLMPDPQEVEAVLFLPLAQARQRPAWEWRAPPPTASGRQPAVSPHLELAGGRVLWGLTARFVHDLVDLLDAGN
jgi:8-oxo-dGTP pyrophosphatase MutT (NUDIX family)